MNATSSAATIGFFTNQSVDRDTVHALGRGACRTFSAATLRLSISLRNSFAVIFRVVGRTAALQGRIDLLNVGLPSSSFSPKVNIASAFNDRPCATYIISENVLQGGTAPAALSSSNGRGGVREEETEIESSALKAMLMVDFSHFARSFGKQQQQNSWHEGGMHLGVCKIPGDRYAIGSVTKTWRECICIPICIPKIVGMYANFLPTEMALEKTVLIFQVW